MQKFFSLFKRLLFKNQISLLCRYDSKYLKKITNRVLTKPITKYSVLFLSFLPFFKKSNEEDEKPPICNNLLARAVYAIENDNNKQALEILHQILTIIGEQLKNEEITATECERKKARIYIEMANVYLMESDMEKASNLIVETMRSCIIAGIHYSSALMIELSLKLALIYQREEKEQDADVGFKFCVDNCYTELAEANLDEDDRVNVEALLGMCCNYYSKFLYASGRHQKSLDMATIALKQAQKVYQENHPNIVNILNDIGVICLALKQHNKAQLKLQEALDICLRHPSEELTESLSVVYSTLGHLHLDRADLEGAEEMCSNSRRYWLARKRTKGGQKIDGKQQHVDDCFFRLAGLKSVDRDD